MSLDTIIEFKNVSVFQEDNLILSDVDFSVKKGEIVYIIGKVGSGKTSIIEIINAQIPIRSGEVYVAGFDLQNIKTKDIPFLRRKLGIVFQDFKLLTDRSVEENLLFVLRATGWKDKKAMDNRLQEVLEKVGLKYKSDKMPHQMSGGEQQRVVIARALLNDPEIILADEPTRNLDPETSFDIMKILSDISKTGRTILMSTHNYNLLKKFIARTLQCENGKLIDLGLSADIDISKLMMDEFEVVV